MRRGNSSKIIQTIEPTTTVLDDGKFLIVRTGLPGVPEEKIKINLDNSSTSITIVASGTENRFRKVITIPHDVCFSRKRFADGVLELVLKRKDHDSL